MAACYAERRGARQRRPTYTAISHTSSAGRSGDHREAAQCLARLRNPMTFDIQFRAEPGATINLSTFQAKYGWLEIDITSRLLEHATRTPNGLFALT